MTHRPLVPSHICRLAAAVFGVAVFHVLVAAAQAQTPPGAAASDAVMALSLERLRQAASVIPGPRPLRINVVKFAESLRTKNFSIKGAAKDPSIQARTAFQVVYPDGTVMIDSGMDLTVHKFFGRGTDEPYDDAAARQVEQAVLKARAVIVTHEHGDHIAGVLRGPHSAEIASKTVLTRTQVNTLLNTPQMPEIRMTEEMAKRYFIIDYADYYPFAPGMALMKAGGHTPGSQMIYVALASGAEYVFAGDSAWHMDGVRLLKEKDAPWITEDNTAIMAQLQWLNRIDRGEKNVHVVISHDDEQRKDYIQRGLLGGTFE